MINFFKRSSMITQIVMIVLIGYIIKSSLEMLLSGYSIFSFWFILLTFGKIIIAFFILSFVSDIFDTSKAEKENKKNAFLPLAVATGTLFGKKHVAGMKKGRTACLKLEDCCQNFVCFGGIGSGKTSRFMLPVLMKILNNSKDINCGALIFDVKGDFKDDLFKVFEKDRFTVIGTDTGTPFNLLQDLSPELASSYLKSTFTMNGQTNDAFWTDSAGELCRNALSVLQFTEDYTLQGLYRFLFNPVFQEKAVKAAMEKLPEMTEREKMQLNAAAEYLTDVYGSFDEKVKSSIKATVAQSLSSFQQPDFVEAFCSDKGTLSLFDLIDKGTKIIVQLPIATYGMGAKVVYTFIKLKFFSCIQQRLVTNHDKTRPVLFVCDEYQDLISGSKTGMSDLTFWDKSRSAKCIGIISSQSVSSFRSALGDQLANTVLQNFRNKICFRSEDIPTLKYFQDLCGQVDVMMSSNSSGKSSAALFSKGGSSNNQGKSWSKQLRYVVDGELLRSLKPDYALCFLTSSGCAVDDVLKFTPYWEMKKE